MAKFYFEPKQCKFIPAKYLYGSEDKVEELGYVDFLGKGQYNMQSYHVLVFEISSSEHTVVKTKSDGRKNAYIMQGWKLVNEKGSNEVLEEYLGGEINE